jgi:hypothetical protein
MQGLTRFGFGIAQFEFPIHTKPELPLYFVWKLDNIFLEILNRIPFWKNVFNPGDLAVADGIRHQNANDVPFVKGHWFNPP